MNLEPFHSQRSKTLDMAKGIAIILVVYGHCLRGLVKAEVISEHSLIIYSDYIIYTFHMPIFFMISGLFFKKAAQKSGKEYWFSRIKTIAYPYFFWSILQGSIQIMLAGSGAVNSDLRLERLLAILWDPISPFWFLYALFFCNIIAYVTRNINSLFLLGGSLIIFIISYFFFPYVVTSIFYGLFYFVLGIVLSERDVLKKIPSSWGAAIILLAIFLVVAFTCDIVGIPERLPIPAALLGIAATLAICAAVEKDSTKTLSFGGVINLVGQNSMSIYVMHILVIGFVRTMLLRFMHIESAVIIMPLSIVAATLLPIVIQLFAVRLGVNNLVALPSSATFGAAQRIRRQHSAGSPPDRKP